ncbi:helicase associated domain-containing protein [Streptomyces sp. NPDC046409]|uniref:helicase associated domain-containing protein n=1 Tax=Streptomyces sp. NPDC046409 TaxID=3156675 RepID=UPI0033DE5A6E
MSDADPAAYARPGATPVVVQLGVWISNTRSRKGRLDAEQLAALAELGMDWSRPVAQATATLDR